MCVCVLQFLENVCVDLIILSLFLRFISCLHGKKVRSINTQWYHNRQMLMKIITFFGWIFPSFFFSFLQYLFYTLANYIRSATSLRCFSPVWKKKETAFYQVAIIKCNQRCKCKKMQIKSESSKKRIIFCADVSWEMGRFWIRYKLEMISTSNLVERQNI